MTTLLGQGVPMHFEHFDFGVAMANGIPGAEYNLPRFEEFFRPIAHKLEQFAQRFNLKLEQYPKYEPSWHFRFRHPSGGIAGLQVIMSRELSVTIVGSWAIDNLETLERKIWLGPLHEMQRDDPLLVEALETLLKSIVVMSPDVLKQASFKNLNWKGREEAMRARVLTYPVLKLDS